MLRVVETTQPLSQGEIIADVPFFIIPKAITLKLHGDKDQHKGSPLESASFRQMKEKAATAKKGLLAVDLPMKIEYGIIISQSCDIDNKDWISVARLSPLSDIVGQVRDALELDEPHVLFDIKRRLTEGPDYGW